MTFSPSALSIPKPWTVATLADYFGLPVSALERLCHQFRLPSKAYLGSGQLAVSSQAANTFYEKDVEGLLAIHAALVAGQPVAQVLKQWQQSQSLKSIAAPKEAGNFRSALASVVKASVDKPASANKLETAMLTNSLFAGTGGKRASKKPVFTQLLDELPRSPQLAKDELNQRYTKSDKSTLIETQEACQPELPLPVQPNNSNEDPLDALFAQPAQPRLPMTQLPGLSADAIHHVVSAIRPPEMPKSQPAKAMAPSTTTPTSKSLVSAFNAHRQAVKSRRQPR